MDKEITNLSREQLEKRLGATNKAIGFCLTKDGSCNNVLHSKYGDIFGIKISIISILWFSLLSIFFIAKKEKIFYNCFIISSVFASYFIFIQIFILKAICTLCMIVDVSVIAIFALLFLHKNKIYK